MNNEEAKQLLIRYNAGECTEAEKAILEQWIMELNEGDIDIPQAKIEEIGREIYKKLPGSDGRSQIIKLLSVITAVAAVSVIIIGTLLYFERSPSLDRPFLVTDIPPGGNKATLTLANGKSIHLSTTKTGIVIEADKIAYNDGISIVNDNGNNVSGVTTISTPKGGEYQITLPDGTKVWLNAASTLKFPATFRLVNRKVELSGEAYFEVAKDKKRPFVVTTGQQDVFVLGTHFNINAYETSLIKTTLLEGSVKVTGNNSSSNAKYTILVPGEQSVNRDRSIKVEQVDTDLEIAWQKGKIQFEDEELATVMSMLARWYNIEVEYQYYPTKARFSGSIARSRNISEILELLQSTGDAHFKIKEGRVLVMK